MMSRSIKRLRVWMRHHRPVVLTLGLGLLVTIALSLGIRTWEQRMAWQTQAASFSRAAAERFSAVRRELAMDIEALDGLRALYDASETVTRDEFRVFAHRLLARHPSLQALAWIPRVADSDRLRYEQGAPHAFRDYQFTERGSDGRLLRAARRDEYFPVYFMEPYKGNASTAGFDMASDPTCRAALETARDFGDVRVSGPVRLVQETGEELRIFAYVPVYDRGGSLGTVAQRRERLLGFVSGVFRADGIMAQTLEGVEPAGMELSLFDDDSGRPTLLAQYPGVQPRESMPAGASSSPAWKVLSERETFVVGGRPWSLLAAPTEHAYASSVSVRAWTVFLVGLMVTAWLAAYLQSIRAYAARVVVTLDRLASEVAAHQGTMDALKESEARFRRILESDPDATILVAPDGRIQMANPQAVMLFGYPAEELVGMSVETLVPESARERHVEHRRRYLGDARTRPMGSLRNLMALRKDGSTVPVDLTLGPMEGADGVSVVASVRDVTERYLTEQKLRRLNRTYAVLSEGNQTLVRAADEQSLLDTFCRIVVETGGYAFATVGYVGENAELPLRVQASAGDPSLASAMCAESPTGAALIRSLEVPAVSRLEPAVRKCSADAQATAGEQADPDQRGCAVITLPLAENGRAFGRFTLYAAETEAFDDEEVKLLGELAQDLAFGIHTLRTRAARERAEGLLHLRNRAIEATRNGVAITDNTRPGNPLIYVNPAYERITGYSAREVLGQNPVLLQREDRNQPGVEEINAALRQRRAGWSVLRNYRKDGSLFWNELHVAPVEDESSGEVTHFVGILNDVTERVRYEEELERQATHDELTSLPNRNLLHDRLEQALIHADRHGHQAAVLFLDLDHFKVINDGLGHRAGDGLLKTVAARLADTARDADTVARYGGDEFVIVLAEIHAPTDLTGIVDRLRAAVAAPVMIDGHEVTSTVTIGVSLYPRDGDNVDTLLKNADGAMYRAKEMGRDGVQFFTEELNARLTDRLKLAGELRRALSRGEMSLHYQPQVAVETGVVVGMEALLRWQHPELGFVPPDRFIPVAEESGLIVSLGAWVLRSACTQIRRWQDHGIEVPQLAVNLSARQLREPELVNTVRNALDETGLPASHLELEVTETAVMERPAETLATLRTLREMGVSLALDDFGTGYSSLSYLKNYPFDKVKIDRSFVKDVLEDPSDAALTTTIISMAHGLRLHAVAEGVETAEQLEFLRQNACDEFQGYYFSRPLPADDMQAFLEGAGDSNAG